MLAKKIKERRCKGIDKIIDQMSDPILDQYLADAKRRIQEQKQEFNLLQDVVKAFEKHGYSVVRTGLLEEDSSRLVPLKSYGE